MYYRSQRASKTQINRTQSAHSAPIAGTPSGWPSPEAGHCCISTVTNSGAGVKPLSTEDLGLSKAPDMRCPCGKEWKPPPGWGLYRNDEVEELKRDCELLDEFAGRIRQRGGERGDKGGRGKEAKKLSPSREKAYQAYQIAVEAGKDGSYREAFEHLLIFGPDEYDLPARWETFGDYVREAKRFYEVRARSIPKTSRQIEDLDDITNKYRTD